MVHREKVVQIHQRTNICQWKQVSYLTIFGWGHLERGEGGEREQKREDEKDRERGVKYMDRKIYILAVFRILNDIHSIIHPVTLPFIE